MSEERNAIQAPPLNDRSTGLVVFGLIHFCLGGTAALTAALTVFVMVVMGPMVDEAARARVDTRMMLLVLVSCVAAATWFIAMGFGSMLARRWARAVILVSSWLWLIFGLSWMAMMSFFMGDVFGQAFQESSMPPAMAQPMKVVIFGFMAFLYVVVPGTLILFYRGESVKATCEARNPSASWTDACPLPVLTQALVIGSWTVFILYAACSNWTVPFFGLILHGAAGAVVTLLSGCVGGGLAWGLYRLKNPAWWGSIMFVTLLGLSHIVTFSRVSKMDYYEKMGMPKQQLEVVRKLHETQSIDAVWLYTVLFLSIFLFSLVVYNRRYFFASEGRN